MSQAVIKLKSGVIKKGVTSRRALKTEHYLLEGNSRSPAELLVSLPVPALVRPVFSTPDIGRYLTSVTSAKVLTLWCAQHASKENAAPPQKVALLADSLPPFLTLPEIQYKYINNWGYNEGEKGTI